MVFKKPAERTVKISLPEQHSAFRELVWIIIRFQFGISLHEWAFQKAEIEWATSASAISAFGKTHKCKLISNWETVWLLIITYYYYKHEKIRTEKVPEDVSWSHFFRIWENYFQSFRTKFLSLLYMISLAYKISHCLSANYDPELQCVICTGNTLKLHCSQPIRIESFFYMYYYNWNSLGFQLMPKKTRLHTNWLRLHHSVFWPASGWKSSNQRTVDHKYCFLTNQRKIYNLVFEHMIRQVNVSCCSSPHLNTGRECMIAG